MSPKIIAVNLFADTFTRTKHQSQCLSELPKGKVLCGLSQN
jgi:hypothetical protein